MQLQSDTDYVYLHHNNNVHDDNGNVSKNDVDNLKHVQIPTDVNINHSYIRYYCYQRLDRRGTNAVCKLHSHELNKMGFQLQSRNFF